MEVSRCGKRVPMHCCVVGCASICSSCHTGQWLSWWGQCQW